MKLRDIAHSRTGDKGNILNASLIVYKSEYYSIIKNVVTAEKVKELFQDKVQGKVERYELPQLGALNFVLYDALNGGVTKSLSIDTHGKCFSSILLDMEIEI